MQTDEIERYLEQAREIVASADAVLITAGAGMGVDSGLPDFRGKIGFWKAYPIAKVRGLSFESLANPEWFWREPSLAWAFYGHRLNLYRDTVPHEGFKMLLELCKSKNDDYFVVTSNVDGQFQKAGFDPNKIYEIHGSIHHLQCTGSKDHGVWSADNEIIDVDMETFKASEPFPLCPECGKIARPNILMFGDWDWLEKRSKYQLKRYADWKKEVAAEKIKVAVIEIGAGTAIASIRRMSESAAREFRTSVIRINPRDYQGELGTLKLPFGGFEGIEQILEPLDRFFCDQENSNETIAFNFFRTNLLEEVFPKLKVYFQKDSTIYDICLNDEKITIITSGISDEMVEIIKEKCLIQMNAVCDRYCYVDLDVVGLIEIVNNH